MPDIGAPLAFTTVKGVPILKHCYFATTSARLAANQLRHESWPYYQAKVGFYQLLPLENCFLLDGVTQAVDGTSWGTLESHWVRQVNATMLAAALAALPAKPTQSPQGAFVRTQIADNGTGTLTCALDEGLTLASLSDLANYELVVTRGDARVSPFTEEGVLRRDLLPESPFELYDDDGNGGFAFDATAASTNPRFQQAVQAVPGFGTGGGTTPTNPGIIPVFADNDAPVMFIFGQSNAQSNAQADEAQYSPILEFSPNIFQAFSNTLILGPNGSSSFTALQEGQNTGGSTYTFPIGDNGIWPDNSKPTFSIVGVGVEYGVADFIKGLNLNVPMRIVKVAVGGTSITYWQKGQPGYTALLSAKNSAFASLSGKNIRVFGLYFNQGEADAGMSTTQYNTLLTQMLADLTADGFKTSDESKFLLAGTPVCADTGSPYANPQNAVKEAYANAHSDTIYLTPSRVTLEHDEIHWDLATQYLYGNIIIPNAMFGLTRVLPAAIVPPAPTLAYDATAGTVTVTPPTSAWQQKEFYYQKNTDTAKRLRNRWTIPVVAGDVLNVYSRTVAGRAQSGAATLTIPGGGSGGGTPAPGTTFMGLPSSVNWKTAFNGDNGLASLVAGQPDMVVRNGHGAATIIANGINTKKAFDFNSDESDVMQIDLADPDTSVRKYVVATVVHVDSYVGQGGQGMLLNSDSMYWSLDTGYDNATHCQSKATGSAIPTGQKKVVVWYILEDGTAMLRVDGQSYAGSTADGTGSVSLQPATSFVFGDYGGGGWNLDAQVGCVAIGYGSITEAVASQIEKALKTYYGI